jgi:hypothetical protein
MQVKDRSSSLIAIRAAMLREPGRPLRIEMLEMGGSREDEVLVRLVATSLLRSHAIKSGVWIAIKIPHASDFFQSRHKISIKSGTERKNERITPPGMTQEITSKPPQSLNKIDDL